MKLLSFLWCLLVFTIVFTPQLQAQEVHNELQGTYRGKVIEVVSSEERTVPGTQTATPVQTIDVEILDGPFDGDIITIENDFLALDEGDRFYFNYNVYLDGSESYAVTNIDRRGPLMVFVGLFAFAVIALGGWQGVRSLVALGVSFLAIFYVLLPGLLAGYNPLLLSFLVAAGILFGAIFFTHGFNRESLVAYGGTMLAVGLTGILAIMAVGATELSGFASDESVYLNFNTDGLLDFTGLLLGAIIVGVLGVLDDIAVTQAAVVVELYNSNSKLSPRDVYKRALRVGREHVGALVNTLVLAYAGASLPMLMYFYLAPVGFWSLINSEIFATEIIRAVVGSIGLIMTVPIVTGLAVWYLKDYQSQHSHGHSHGHSHH
jgi:uncharacterized membrane protein